MAAPLTLIKESPPCAAFAARPVKPRPVMWIAAMGEEFVPAYARAGDIADELAALAAKLESEFAGIHLHLVSFPMADGITE